MLKKYYWSKSDVMSVGVSCTIGVKQKFAVKWLVKEGYYTSESDFFKKAIENQLSKDERQGKFRWKDVVPKVD